jgi:hypothetical protein
MAKRDLITKGIKIFDNGKDGEPGHEFSPESIKYKELIKELIRLDVPILEIGSSSIGKSYSIRQFMEQSGVRGEFLFVGTEKSEFIEGIPNLKEITSGQAKFNYLKPYWFPDKEFIRCRLINGRNQILQASSNTFRESVGGYKSIGELWNAAKSDYKLIEDLKEQLLKYKRTDKEIKEGAKTPCQKIVPDFVVGKYIYEDALLYLSTLQGYGNFWLILDEIDKVEKQDKDKYAPLLHIVRERELKGWKLSGLREFPEYDIKYVTTIGTRIERLDAALNDPKADVTDTRIIAIANDLQTMEEESPALYRRFVKIVIDKSLYDEKAPQAPSGDSSIAVGFDWAKQYELKKQQLHLCIANKEVVSEKVANTKTGIDKNVYSSIIEMMAKIDSDKRGKRLDEMNLAWTLGFFPEILFPGADTRGQGVAFVNNIIIEDFNNEPDPYKTLMFKIIQDNFALKYWVPLLECIYDRIDIKGTTESSSTGIDADVDKLFSEGGMTRDKFNSPNPMNVANIIDKYKVKLKFAEGQYAESLEVQRKRQRGEAVTDKQIAGLDKGVAVTSRDAIVFGNIMIQRSMDGKNPTEFTRMLISSVPFLQTNFIASPYIPFDASKDLTAIADNGMVNIITKISGKDFSKESEALEAVRDTFSKIEPYRPFVVKYAMGIPSEYQEAIIEGDYKKITNPSETIRQIIANKPVIVDSGLINLLSPVKDKELKKEYFESVANVRILDKEIYQNLSYEVWPMVKNSAEQNGMTPILKDQVKYYAEKFPNAMKTLANSLTDTDGLDELKLFIMGIVDSGVQGSEIDTARKFRDGGMMANGGGVGDDFTYQIESQVGIQNWGKENEKRITYWGGKVSVNGELAVFIPYSYDSREEAEARAKKIIEELKSGKFKGFNLTPERLMEKYSRGVYAKGGGVDSGGVGLSRDIYSIGDEVVYGWNGKYYKRGKINSRIDEDTYSILENNGNKITLNRKDFDFAPTDIDTYTKGLGLMANGGGVDDPTRKKIIEALEEQIRYEDKTPPIRHWDSVNLLAYLKEKSSAKTLKNKQKIIDALEEQIRYEDKTPPIRHWDSVDLLAYLKNEWGS